MLLPKLISSVLSAKTERVFIAYSGGVDSHVLLHLVSLISDIKEKVIAVHVHHGLQIEADSWVQHCELEASKIGINFHCLKVDVQKNSGQSQEEVARDARYQALKLLLNKNDVLLVAQHREDQMETLLLQLFRGAGVQGLSGMASSNTFGLGLICRPLLDIAKHEINQYAANHQLSWIEDPSNICDDFDRNFLRNQIVPQLKQRWPALDKTIARSARHCANSFELTEELARDLFRYLYDENDLTLRISALLELDEIKQSLVIRQWFRKKQLRMPSEKVTERILNEVCLANQNANPEIKGQGYCIRRYRDKLYCLAQSPADRKREDIIWLPGIEQIVLDDGQKIAVKKVSEGIPEKLWKNSDVSIRFRKGAEKIKLPGRVGHHSLKKLFQEQSIPPWQREQFPLIYLNGHLAAVADLWVSADFYQEEKDRCYKIIYVDAL